MTPNNDEPGRLRDREQILLLTAEVARYRERIQLLEDGFAILLESEAKMLLQFKEQMMASSPLPRVAVAVLPQGHEGTVDPE